MMKRDRDFAVAFALSTLIILVFCLRAAGLETSSEIASQDSINAREIKKVEQSAELAETIELSNQVIQLYQAGKYLQALPLAQRALSLAEKTWGPSHLDVANCLINLASLYFSLEDYAHAEPLLQRALAIREKALGTQHPDVAYSLTNLGDLYRAKGDYLRAEELLKRALTMYEHAFGPEHANLATTLNGLGLLCIAKGEFNLAETYYRRGLAISQKAFGPDHPTIALWLNNIGQVLYERREYERAEQFLTRALAIREKAFGPEHPAVATSLNNLAEVYRVKSEYARAERLYQRAILIQKKILGAESLDLANTINNLARLYYDKGDYARVEPLYMQVVGIRRKALGPDHPEVAASIFDLAQLYEAKGDYSSAHGLHQAALDIREKTLGPDHPLVGQSLGSLGGMYRIQGNYVRAESLFQRALTIYEKAWGQDSLNIAAPLSNLALLYLEKGDYDKAKPLAQRALTIAEKGFGPEHPEVAAPLNTLALLAVFRKDYDQGDALLQRSLGIYQKAFGPEHPKVAMTLASLAALYQSKGDIQRAVVYLKRCLEIREKNLSLVTYSGSDDEKRLYLESLSPEIYGAVSLHIKTAPSDPLAAELAFTTILRQKGRALDSMSFAIETLRRNLGKAEQELLEQLFSTQSKLATLALGGPENISPKEHKDAVMQLEVNADQLQDAISRYSEEFGLLTTPVTIEQVQRALPPASVLVELFLYKPFNPTGKALSDRFGSLRYSAYILRKEGQVQGIELGDAAEIDAKATRLRDALRCFPTKRVNCLGIADIRNLARELDGQIMLPVRKHLGNAKHIFLAVDGALNLIPFAALVDEQGKYLVENFLFTYLTSGRDLLRLQVRAEKWQSPVIMADPRFDGANLPAETSASMRGELTTNLRIHFGPLPGTRDEAETLKPLLPGARVLLQAEATESALKKVNGPKVLHIATHGFFLTAPEQKQESVREGRFREGKIQREIALPKDPLLRSGLALEGANRGLSADGEDGLLTALETAGLNLMGTKLVVLSACDTGVGDIKNGEGVYGLRRALVLAGSELQVMSLWKVSDSGTRDLMIAYYTRLQAGEGRSEALRDVQLAMIRGQLSVAANTRKRGTSDTENNFSARDYQRPYFWAAFIQSGDWRNMIGPW